MLAFKNLKRFLRLDNHEKGYGTLKMDNLGFYEFQCNPYMEHMENIDPHLGPKNLQIGPQ